MDFLQLANSRYTTKKYNSELKISDDKLEELKQILRLTPSSINSQPWKFIVVSDKNTKSLLSKESYFNEHKVNDASHVIVFAVIDDLELFEEQIKNNLPEGSINYYHQKIKPLDQTQIKSWMSHQVYIALGFFLSACASLEIDSTTMEGINTKAYDNILQLEKYKTLFAVTIGYRDRNDDNQPSVTPKSRLDIDHVIQTV